MTETAIASRSLELRRAFDEAFAVPADVTRPDTVDLLDLSLAGQRYAIRADEIAGIHLDLVVSPLPGPLPELTGITALRGTLLPVYDLGLVCGVSPCAGRWTVLDAAHTVAFAFSEFHGHVRIAATDLAAHRSGEAAAAPQVARIGDSARPIISVSSLVESITQRASRAGTRRG